MNQPMHGADAADLRAFATQLTRASDALSSSVATLARSVAESGWRGPDADGFVRQWEDALRPALNGVAERLGAQAAVVARHAREQDAASGTGGGATPAAFFGGPVAPPSQDEPGEADTGQDGLGEPGFWDRVKEVGGDAGSFLYDRAAVPLINATAMAVDAALNNPLDVLGIALGAGAIAVGAGGEVGGLALDATGVGAVVGVPINVAAAGLIATGAAAAAAGGGHLLSEATQSGARPLEHSSGRTYSSGEGGKPPTSVDETLESLPRGRSRGVRTVRDDPQLQRTFDSMAEGGKVVPRSGYNGTVVRLEDGTEIGLRATSKSGGRTIDIRYADGRAPGKIHVES